MNSNYSSSRTGSRIMSERDRQARDRNQQNHHQHQHQQKQYQQQQTMGYDSDYDDYDNGKGGKGGVGFSPMVILNGIISFVLGYQFLRLVVMAIVTFVFILRMMEYPLPNLNPSHDVLSPVNDGELKKLSSDIQAIKALVDSKVDKQAAKILDLAVEIVNIKKLIKEGSSQGQTETPSSQIELLEMRLKEHEENLQNQILSLKQKHQDEKNEQMIQHLKLLEDRISKIESGNQDQINFRSVIQEELQKHSADKIGKPDYAIKYAGGQIIHDLTSETYNPTGKSVLDFLYSPNVVPPEVILDPGVVRGRCWPMKVNNNVKGQLGYISINIPKAIYPTEFTLDHIPKSIATDPSSAPQQITVYGYHNPNQLVKLATYTYTVSDDSTQTFPALKQDQKFENFRLEVNSNHGNPKYTCIYRFRIHGSETN